MFIIDKTDFYWDKHLYGAPPVFVDVTQSYVNFKHVTFEIDHYNTDKRYEYHGLYVHGTDSRVIFSDCKFKNMVSSGIGAAVYVEEAYIIIKDSEFEWNAASSGGAIALKHHHAALLENNYFHNNYATIIGRDKTLHIVEY